MSSESKVPTILTELLSQEGGALLREGPKNSQLVVSSGPAPLHLVRRSRVFILHDPNGQRSRYPGSLQRKDQSIPRRPGVACRGVPSFKREATCHWRSEES